MKPVILALMRSYRPGYRGGGPVVSLESLIHHLGDEFDIRIVTPDRDKGDAAPYKGIIHDSWLRVSEGWVRYLPVGWAHWWALLKTVRTEEYQLLYINDLFSPRWGIWPLLIRRAGLLKTRPLLIAPRGQFAAGALGIKSWKKRIFLWFAGISKLFKGVVWHATNEKEAEEIRELIRHPAAVLFAPNLPFAHEQVPWTDSITNPGNLTRLIFLSRISPKKNLEFSLSVLEKVNFPLEYDIYGPIDDSTYWNKLKVLIRSLPENVKVTYKGELVPNQVERTFCQYHAFLFPTLGENFGHVIFESLASGCLPIISDRTPWRDLSENGCGWVIPLENLEGFVIAITDLNKMSGQEYKAHREMALRYAAKYLVESRAVERNREMFRTACASTFIHDV